MAVVLAAALAAVPAGVPASATPRSAPCGSDPGGHLATVPSPEEYLGFPLGAGQQRVVTNDEIRGYLSAVDRASDRVVTGTMGASVRGRPLPYAVVSGRGQVEPGTLDRIAAQIRGLRDPRRLGPGAARRIAAERPAIVWIAGNVHGGETSGADAALKTLYELAAGRSCAARRRADNLITVIVPTQNPDGREALRRQNEYGFDLNRDWFARTQPETDHKIELLRRLPPQVFVDAHEMGGQRYFFPPNADPIHHEIADQPVDWINRIGEANKAGFGYHGPCTDAVTTECYFNYEYYDLFYMGYGDTVPAAGFGAAGMTYEKGGASAVQDRVQQQFHTQWATLGWAAAHKREVLDGYYRIWVDALAEGRAGTLEPNEVVQPTNTVQFPVPDLRIRSYFLMPGRQLADVRRLVERLRRMDVEVYRVTEPVEVPHARIFGGRGATGLTVPAGAYWIPMEQPQKHWIQAVMGEDPYVPFPYFYDVSSWSNPLLAGIDTVYTGDPVRPRAEPVRRIEGGRTRPAPAGGSYTYRADSAAAAQLTFRLLGRGVPVTREPSTDLVRIPARALTPAADRLAGSLGVTLTAGRRPAGGTPIARPDVGLFAGAGISTTSGSYGEARYVLGRQWGLDLTPVTSADINDNTPAFTGRTVLLVPDGGDATGGLTATGQANLRNWIARGHTYIGLRNQGTRMARAAGLTSTTEKPKPADYLVIGSHLRVDVDAGGPVALGRPAEDFQFNNDDPILTPSTTGANVVTYPAGDTFWHNGYTVAADTLKGTSAVVDEPIGAGRAVLFAFNPLFRAYHDSGRQLVANALLAPAGPRSPLSLSPGVDPARARAAAQPAPANLGGQWRPARIQVATADLARTQHLVSRYTDTATVEVAGDSAYLTIPNPDGRQFDEHPFLRDLVGQLRSAGIPLRRVVA
ncbi:M14 family zinc carboxypeptidase [Actinoplanes teichomyceticus]|uniref:Zinc carboxypeptidase n=1 Tax=Actinoplanes teichomyceticus TaxID=1867 RepID=A0A561WK78_ACTTI|nr:M14 family zinc carboxypeptidase [Actinoplanes teichomyceticus]TWG24272.1 zinc carboxypeptidase [Actinoplanes teichomyceticus]GIF12882.1 peptidase M14 [Actinoplanes teichomyceticus]